jgi:hypothetical protein
VGLPLLLGTSQLYSGTVFVLNPYTTQQNKIRLSLLNSMHEKLNFVNTLTGEHANYIVIISWKEEM